MSVWHQRQCPVPDSSVENQHDTGLRNPQSSRGARDMGVGTHKYKMAFGGQWNSLALAGGDCDWVIPSQNSSKCTKKGEFTMYKLYLKKPDFKAIQESMCSGSNDLCGKMNKCPFKVLQPGWENRKGFSYAETVTEASQCRGHCEQGDGACADLWLRKRPGFLWEEGSQRHKLKTQDSSPGLHIQITWRILIPAWDIFHDAVPKK